MEIMLICRDNSGQTAFPAEDIEGIPAPERRYDIVNGRVVLAGFSDAILHHDADVLLSMSLFRMPTPQEQESFMQEAQKASVVQEGDGPAPTDPDPEDEPPAQSKKKAAGG